MPEMRNQRADAMAYLEEHKILKLFDILGVKLAQQVLNIQTDSEGRKMSRDSIYTLTIPHQLTSRNRNRQTTF